MWAACFVLGVSNMCSKQCWRRNSNANAIRTLDSQPCGYLQFCSVCTKQQTEQPKSLNLEGHCPLGSWYRVPKVRGCEPQEPEEESHFPPSPTTSGCCLLTACLDKPHGAPSSLLAKETCWRQCFGSRNLCPDTKHTRYPTSSAPMGQLTQTSSIMEESKKD